MNVFRNKNKASQLTDAEKKSPIKWKINIFDDLLMVDYKINGYYLEEILANPQSRLFYL